MRLRHIEIFHAIYMTGSITYDALNSSQVDKTTNNKY
jgi:hypothetical protein